VVAPWDGVGLALVLADLTPTADTLERVHLPVRAIELPQIGLSARSSMTAGAWLALSPDLTAPLRGWLDRA
jgi:hypothetical protein